jgi:glycerophosphoryl diester phosphodiesterase
VRGVVALALVAAVAGVGLGAERRPLVAAHRGGALLWPENSLRAFREALALGVDLVETDVHLTADGEVVIIHDPTLDRTTTGQGPVRDARRADLAALRLRGRDGRPTEEPIPTLRQLLALLGPTRAGLLLEIKVGPDRRRYPGIEEAVLARLAEAGLAPRTRVMAFEPETLARLRELDPALPTVWLVSRRTLEAAGRSAAEVVESAAGAGFRHLGIEHRLLDAPVMAAARAAGVTVGAWTVNEEADIRRVAALGADVVITDRPDLALSIVGR